MDGLWVYYRELGCGVILISSDWICCLVPYFWGDGEIATNFVKNLACPYSPTTCNQMVQHMKRENILLKEGLLPDILVKNMQIPIFEAWQTHTRCLLYYQSPDGTTCRLPSGLSAAVENDTIAAN